MIKVDIDERKIGLSLRRALEEGAPPPEKAAVPPTPPAEEAPAAEEASAAEEAPEQPAEGGEG